MDERKDHGLIIVDYEQLKNFIKHSPINRLE
jgi:hypothetical protein